MSYDQTFMGDLEVEVEGEKLSIPLAGLVQV